MEKKEPEKKKGVAALREFFYEIKRNQKPSWELEESTRDPNYRKMTIF